MIQKIIILDLDGVIVDSREAHAEAFNLAFKKNHLPELPPKRIWKEFGPPRGVVIRKLVPRISQRKLEAVSKQKNEFLLEKTFKLTKPIKGADSAIFELKKVWKVALVSNAEHSEILQLLGCGEVNARLFDLIIGADDIKKHKPDPTIVKTVEKKLGGKVEFIVGDHPIDVELGKRAGVKTIAVLSGVGTLEELSEADHTLIARDITLVPEVLYGKI